MERASRKQYQSVLKYDGQESNSSEDESRQQSFGWICVQLSSSAACGIIFGFALEKGRVFEPQVIIDQMLFTRFVMLKMFLSASATSMFVFSSLSMLPATHQHFARAMREFTSGFGNKGVVSSLVGGSILGIGMTLSGACPGMIMVQVGTGTQNAVITLLGGLCGVVVYALMEPFMVRATKPKSPLQQHFLHQHVGGPYFNVALPFVVVLGVVVFAAELYAPWDSEVTVGGEGILGSLSWPPYMAGIVVGLLQIPTVLINCDTLGTSTSYCAVLAQGCRFPSVRRLFSYLAAYRSGASNWWQVFYAGGAVAGAYLSQWMAGSAGGTPGVSPVAAFIGGACLLFGSRLAAGCTSGHGLSGMGLLSVLSLVAVPAMFAGGIGTAVLSTML
ncbi:uncharacterized protein LOC143281215 [Babylonia areolata]|uniref:uncharacterized protein LOC143281215 n=1 Tax=Babylonia areolata TaxID=304850 RepID=UPI003FD4C20C